MTFLEMLHVLLLTFVRSGALVCFSVVVNSLHRRIVIAVQLAQGLQTRTKYVETNFDAKGSGNETHDNHCSFRNCAITKDYTSRSTSQKARSMLADYYANENVRARLLEFLGGRTIDDATAAFITADDSSADVQYSPRPVRDLWRCLEAGHEIGRSLWDTDGLIVDLDIEYVNFDFPAKPYVQPKRSFELQRPVVNAIENKLLATGISPLHLLSGRGHHFLWKIDKESEAFGSLCNLGRLSDSLRQRYSQPNPASRHKVSETLGNAFSGLGMVLEYFGHTILRECRDKCEIPIQLTAVEVVPGKQGREIISIDLSEYGDDLCSRGVRMPYSVYLKPDQQRYCLGDPFVDAMPALFSIPLHEMNVVQAMETMRSAELTAELAARASVRIPNCSDSMMGLIEQYLQSKLAAFHDDFYRDQHDPPETWVNTYDRTPLDPLPSCIRKTIEQPNELLLKPAAIQNVVRALMAYGWSPRHIAGLIRSKYERDYSWGDKWIRYDATSRADFYVRLFAGQIVTGVDSLADFNCRSTQEKQYCPNPCSHNLVDLHDGLKQRIASQ